MNRAVSNRRLLQLAELLESLPRKRFDYQHWGLAAERNVKKGRDVLENVGECGTTACALGWAPSLPFAKKLGISLRVSKSGILSPDGQQYADFFEGETKAAADDVAYALFGLSYMATMFLFYPDTKYAGLRSPKANASAKTVAKHIRRFVALRSL